MSSHLIDSQSYRKPLNEPRWAQPKANIRFKLFDIVCICIEDNRIPMHLCITKVYTWVYLALSKELRSRLYIYIEVLIQKAR